MKLSPNQKPCISIRNCPFFRKDGLCDYVDTPKGRILPYFYTPEYDEVDNPILQDILLGCVIRNNLTELDMIKSFGWRFE